MDSKTLHAILKLSGINCSYCGTPMEIRDIRRIDDDLYLLRVKDYGICAYAVYSMSRGAMNSGGTFCPSGRKSWCSWEDGEETSKHHLKSFGKKTQE